MERGGCVPLPVIKHEKSFRPRESRLEPSTWGASLLPFLASSTAGYVTDAQDGQWTQIEWVRWSSLSIRVRSRTAKTLTWSETRKC